MAPIIRTNSTPSVNEKHVPGLSELEILTTANVGLDSGNEWNGYNNVCETRKGYIRVGPSLQWFEVAQPALSEAQRFIVQRSATPAMTYAHEAWSSTHDNKFNFLSNLWDLPECPTEIDLVVYISLLSNPSFPSNDIVKIMHIKAASGYGTKQLESIKHHNRLKQERVKLELHMYSRYNIRIPRSVWRSFRIAPT